MTKQRIITDYSTLTDADLDITASAGIKGMTGNTNFTFTHSELTNATTAQTDYHTALAALTTGSSATVTAKNTARQKLIDTLYVLAAQINIQSNGDLKILQGTGFPLAKKGSHQTMGEIINFQVRRGTVAGTMELSVANPGYSHHGTVFAFWNPDLGATPKDIDDWFQRSANGHSITLTGLTPGKTYSFSSAYKGSDDDDLVWGSIVSKMVGD
ncbi:hypothetical protein [Parasediminibacterium sp. JCM 36343]|uniref:hypothetical protein n=1 Tax=Parasediminibacterium sp. JCM 36343 TaxID=3374279 RepID=UPI00397CC79C